MILLRDYDKEKLLDRVWYDSSNIFYSECDDTKNGLKVLRVVFKNGATYQYKNVDVNDYVMFVNGGLDGSNGKSLNKFIKPKCEFEKLENMDMNFLTEEFTRLKEEKEQKKNAEQTN